MLPNVPSAFCTNSEVSKYCAHHVAVGTVRIELRLVDIRADEVRPVPADSGQRVVPPACEIEREASLPGHVRVVPQPFSSTPAGAVQRETRDLPNAGQLEVVRHIIARPPVIERRLNGLVHRESSRSLDHV